MKSAHLIKRGFALSLSKGFTLIELLVVIGILAVLLAIVLIAINPARQFAQANDIQRRSDVNAILNSIHQYSAENKGLLPAPLTAGNSYAVASTGGSGETGAAFCNFLVPTFIAQLPRDPQTGTWTDCSTYSAGYTIVIATASAGQTPRVTVTAVPQLATSISVTR